MRILEFFKTANNRPSQDDLDRLKRYYEDLTAGLSDSWALGNLDSPEKCHWLMLLKLADYARSGKTFAIFTAFKLGYLHGQGRIELGIPDWYEDEAKCAEEYRGRILEIIGDEKDVDRLARMYYSVKHTKEERA